MIRSDVVSLLSDDPLRQLDERLRAGGRGFGDVLALTFFVDARDDVTYRAAKNTILDAMAGAFGDAQPPASFVAQPPEGDGRVALEAAVLSAPSPGIQLRRETVDGHAYTVLDGMGVRQVHACTPSRAGTTDPVRQSEEAFAGMEAILGREELTCGQVVRQWNYLEGVLLHRDAEDKDHQIYQAFNDVRTGVYSRSGFVAGYPASTGIGQSAGGVIIEFLALSAPPDVRVEPVTNPRQIDAHRYSDEVLVGDPLDDRSGRTAPKFERAKLVARGDEGTIFVSGTASILGEESVALGDVVGQARTTIDVISALIQGEKLTHLRAYVKRTSDIPAVREVCEEAYGAIPALYVTADICRDELLVEIEGACNLGSR